MLAHALRIAVAAALLAAPLGAAALEQVEVQSLERDAAGAAQMLRAFYARPAHGARVPAAVFAHGCGGAYARDGSIDRRLRAMADLALGEGFAVLVLDSFSTRGVREICTQRLDDRRIGTGTRRLDAFGALGWLAAREEVHADRMVLVGFSHGGATTLATIGFNPPAAARGKFAAAIAFYPSCRGYLGREPPFAPRAPLTVLIGEADDWTPAERCVQLEAESRARGVPFELHLFPGAHHGFDSHAPVRVRHGIPNSATGSVHVGGDPAAREVAYDIVRKVLRSIR